MRIAFGADHAGFALKEHLRAAAAADGHEVIDLGTDSNGSVDYPDFGAAVARAVVAGEADRGVLVCGSGNGIAIAANKVTGARAAVVHDVTSARLAVEHNDANVCAIGARFVGEQVAEDAMRAYLGAEFAGGRHATRVEKIARLEQD
ncbi:MAG: ribose 5-phosphate isomerase B [Actinomycetes bacterium]